MWYYSDNPPLDADRYFSDLEREAEKRGIGECFYCGEPITAGQEYIDCEDGLIHWECWDDYGRDKKERA